MTRSIKYAPPAKWTQPRNYEGLLSLLTQTLTQCLDDDLRPSVSITWSRGEAPEHDHVLYGRLEAEPKSKAYRILLGRQGEHFRAIELVLGLMARTDGFVVSLNLVDKKPA